MTEPINVAICVATFRRARGLACLLESFQSLDTGDLDVNLIIADNDARESGRSAFEAYRDRLPFAVTYIVEPTRGLAAIRNRLVAEAYEVGARYVAFADDDQTTDPGWLRELVVAAEKCNADIVAPNLKYCFPTTTSPAIRRCFLTKSPPTGTPILNTGSGGTLYAMKALVDYNGPFDVRANFSGGEDTLLGAMVRAQGGTIISCNSSYICEHMPTSRLNFRWIAKRAWREGNSRCQEVKWVTPSLARSLWWCILFVGFTVLNGLMVIPDAVRYRQIPLRRFRLMIFGISGLWHMLFGISTYEERNTIYGS